MDVFSELFFSLGMVYWILNYDEVKNINILYKNYIKKQKIILPFKNNITNIFIA